MLLFLLPVFLITIYWGGLNLEHFGPFWTTVKHLTIFILKYVLILVLVILIKNVNPRVRIDQAMRFFWIPVAVFAVIGMLVYGI